MKAEEEDVDIDTIVSHTASAGGRKSGGGTLSGNMGGAATPVSSSGNAAHVGDIGTMSEVAMGDAGAIDIDLIWAEESPDDDLPAGWKMRVVMDNEAADYY
jgi:COMPASS component SWD1